MREVAAICLSMIEGQEGADSRMLPERVPNRDGRRGTSPVQLGPALTPAAAPAYMLSAPEAGDADRTRSRPVSGSSGGL